MHFIEFQNEDYEIFSLFQYDPVSQTIQFPILESEWKALSKHATVSVIASTGQGPISYLHGLEDRKVLVKMEGKVVATYHQPQQTDNSSTESVQVVLSCRLFCISAHNLYLPNIPELCRRQLKVG